MSGCSSRAGATPGAARRRTRPSASSRNGRMDDMVSTNLHRSDALPSAGGAGRRPRNRASWRRVVSHEAVCRPHGTGGRGGTGAGWRPGTLGRTRTRGSPRNGTVVVGRRRRLVLLPERGLSLPAVLVLSERGDVLPVHGDVSRHVCKRLTRARHYLRRGGSGR